MWNRSWLRTVGSGVATVERGAWLRWLLSAFALWLIVSTRPLWLSVGEFPQVPWFAWGCGVPRTIDLYLLITVVAALIGVAGTRSESSANQCSLALFVAGLTGLMLLDQHRSQPWAYQFILTASVLAVAPRCHALSLLRLLTISIYVHSAVSKCDYSFCLGLGRSFLLELSQFLWGSPPAGVLPWATGAWPLLFPVGELLIAGALIWPFTRRWGLWGAAGMHLLLLVVLGPWGLQHSSGVLIWNGYFMAQNFVLFGGMKQNSINPMGGARVVVEPSAGRQTRWRKWASSLLMGWVVLWPCGEPWGYCDLWPAWGLYAQHGEQLTVHMADPGWHRLPVQWQRTAVRSVIADGAESWGWQLRPQQVSLNVVAAPIYPQNRFQLGVVADLIQRSGIPPNEISASWFSPANRWTGERQITILKSFAEIQDAADRCWLNARPRN